MTEPFGYFKAEPFGWTDCAETDEGAVALYLAPPTQRPWVGLTDEEIEQLASKHLDVGDGSYATHFVTGGVEFARAIEAKLKEKNDANGNT